MDEALLVAYVDGMLGEAEREGVERALARDPQARAKVARLRRVDLPVAAAFEGLLDRPVPAEMVERVLPSENQGRGRQKRVLRMRALAAAAVLVAFAAGLSVGLLWDRESGLSGGAMAQRYAWVMPVAQVQKLTVRSALEDDEVSPKEVRRLSGRLARWLGQAVHVPDLSAFGLVLRHGQVLEVMEKPVGQLIYRSGQGETIGLSIVPAAEPDEAPVVGEAEGLTVLHWRKGGLAFALIGAADPGYLQAVAAPIRQAGTS